MSSETIALLQAQLGSLPKETLDGLPPLPPIGTPWLASPIAFAILSGVLFALALLALSRHRETTHARLFSREIRASGEVIWRPNASQQWAFWWACFALLALAGDGMSIYGILRNIFFIKYAQIPIILSLLCAWTGMWFALCGISFALPQTVQTHWTSALPSPRRLQLGMILGITVLWLVVLSILAVRTVYVVQLQRRIDDAVMQVTVLATQLGIDIHNSNSLSAISAIPQSLLIALLAPIVRPIKDVYRITSALTFAMSIFWCVANLILFIFAALISAWLLDQLSSHIREVKAMADRIPDQVILEPEDFEDSGRGRFRHALDTPTKEVPTKDGQTRALAEDYFSVSLVRPPIASRLQTAHTTSSAASTIQRDISEPSEQRGSSENSQHGKRPLSLQTGLVREDEASAASRASESPEKARDLLEFLNTSEPDCKRMAEQAGVRSASLTGMSGTDRPSLLKRLSGSHQTTRVRGHESQLATLVAIRYGLAVQYLGLSICLLLYVVLAVLAIFTTDPAWDLPVYVAGEILNHCAIVAMILIIQRPKDIRRSS